MTWLISGRLGSAITWMMPAGAPACSAALAIASTPSAVHFFASGCGEMMMALRVISASRTLKNAVQTGLVEGVRANTMPAARGTSTIFCSAITRLEQKSSPL